MTDQQQKYDEWHQDPNNWKWGAFYYNKEDDRLLPPKRIKAMGWTVNFANTKSVILFFIMLMSIPLIGWLVSR